MSKTLNFTARLMAVIFAALFVIVTPPVLILSVLGWQLFSPDLYKRALADQSIYERFPALVAEQIAYQVNLTAPDIENMSDSPQLQACVKRALGEEAYNAVASFQRQPTAAEIELIKPCAEWYGEREQAGEGGPPPALGSLSQADWKALLSILIPTAWLQTQTESAIDQVFASLDSDDPTQPITISLLPLKEHLGEGAAVAAYLRLVRAQPACTDEQLAALADAPPTELPPCRPPEEMLNATIAQNQNMLSEVVAKIPDEADLSQIGKSGNDVGGAPPPGSGGPLGDNPRQTLRRVRMIMRLSPLLPVALLLLMTLSAVRSLKAWLRWWGVPFLIVGLIGVAAVVAARSVPTMNRAFATYVAGKVPPSVSPGLLHMVMDIQRNIFGSLAARLGVDAAVIGASGAAMLAGSVFVSPKQAGNVTADTAAPERELRDGAQVPERPQSLPEPSSVKPLPGDGAQAVEQSQARAGAPPTRRTRLAFQIMGIAGLAFGLAYIAALLFIAVTLGEDQDKANGALGLTSIVCLLPAMVLLGGAAGTWLLFVWRHAKRSNERRPD